MWCIFTAWIFRRLFDLSWRFECWFLFHCLHENTGEAHLHLWAFAAKGSHSRHISLVPNGPKSCWFCPSIYFWEENRGVNLLINSLPIVHRGPSGTTGKTESRMDRLASRVVTLGLALMGRQRRSVCVCVVLCCFCACVCLQWNFFLHILTYKNTANIQIVKMRFLWNQVLIWRSWLKLI